MFQQQNAVDGSKTNPVELLIDMQEHDMPLHVRVSIFMGSWYDVMCKGSNE